MGDQELKTYLQEMRDAADASSVGWGVMYVGAGMIVTALLLYLGSWIGWIPDVQAEVTLLVIGGVGGVSGFLLDYFRVRRKMWRESHRRSVSQQSQIKKLSDEFWRRVVEDGRAVIAQVNEFGYTRKDPKDYRKAFRIMLAKSPEWQRIRGHVKLKRDSKESKKDNEETSDVDRVISFIRRLNSRLNEIEEGITPPTPET